MAKKNIGFIGAGNMAQAIFRRLLAQGFVAPENLIISDVSPGLPRALADELKLKIARDNVELVQRADVIVLAVKPIYCASVLEEIKPHVGHKPVLSIVSSWTLGMLQDGLGTAAHILRVMPNTPAMVGEGMTLLGREHTLTGEEFDNAKALFDTVGSVAVLEERLFNAATCISGCGPAFIYQVIEALGDAGVMHGLPRVQAYQLASQMVLGAGKMVRDTGMHPGALKDAVCSPGGTTILGVHVLDKAGIRGTFADAVTAALTKTDALSKK